MTAFATAHVITPHTPLLSNGRGVRTYAVIAALSRKRRVHVTYLNVEREEPAPEYSALPATFSSIDVDDQHRLMTVARAVCAGVPTPIARALTHDFVDAAKRAARTDALLVADGPVAAAAARGHLPRYVYNAHNLEEDRAAAIGWNPLDRSLISRFERRVFREAAEAWLVSSGDIDRAERRARGRYRLVPNCVELPVLDQPGTSSDCVILFVGDCTYGPNSEAADYLARDVLPLVRQQISGAMLLVAGRGWCPPPVEWVDYRGFVPDLAPLYLRAAVVAAPIRRGGGAQLKAIEAMAYAKPLVCSHFVADGIGARDRSTVLVADEPQEVAHRLVEVLRGSHTHIGHSARRLVEDSFSIDALASALP